MTRTRLIRWLWITTVSVVGLLLCSGAVIYWLTSTDQGFRHLLGLASHVPGVSISAEGTNGTPAAGLDIERLSIDHERVHVDIEHLHLRLRPAALLGGTINITELRAAAVRVQLLPAVRPPDHTAAAFLPSFLRLHTEVMTVDLLEVSDDSGPLFAATRVGATVSMTRSTIVLEDLSAAGGNFALAGNLQLSAADPLLIAGALDLVLPIGDERLEVHGMLGGNLQRLILDASLKRPDGTRFKGTVDLTGAPSVDGVLTLGTTDLAPLLTDQPLGRIDAKLNVNGSLAHFSVQGPIEAKAIALGPLALQATGGFAHDTLTLDQVLLNAKGNAPQLTLSGSVRTKPRTEVDLTLKWLRLRWPLKGAPDVESAAGSARLSGAAPSAFARHHAHRRKAAAGCSRRTWHDKQRARRHRRTEREGARWPDKRARRCGAGQAPGMERDGERRSA